MTVLITGASGGIGKELARIFAAHRHDLVLVARSEDKLRSLGDELSRAHGIQAHVHAADLTDAATPQRLFEAVNSLHIPIDALVNNAGFGRLGAYTEVDFATAARMIQLNIVALAHLTHLFLPAMLERRSGKILNVASTAAFVPGPFMAVYYASKAFVLSFSEALAEETDSTGVTVTTLCPGATETNFARTAGNQNSNVFRTGMIMDARTVARAAYDGLMAGQRLVVPGWRNQVTIFSTRLAPRTLLAKVVRKLNSTA